VFLKWANQFVFKAISLITQAYLKIYGTCTLLFSSGPKPPINIYLWNYYRSGNFLLANFAAHTHGFSLHSLIKNITAISHGKAFIELEKSRVRNHKSFACVLSVSDGKRKPPEARKSDALITTFASMLSISISMTVLFQCRLITSPNNNELPTQIAR
jgi:hypothetical protein